MAEKTNYGLWVYRDQEDYIAYDDYLPEVYDKVEADRWFNKYKRKRCLDMAGRCEDKLKTIQAGVIRTYEYPYLMTCPAECTPTYHFYKRWQTRWLQLADKYKEES